MADPRRDEQAWTDEIVAPVRSARKQLFADCDYDLEKLVDPSAERRRRAAGPS